MIFLATLLLGWISLRRLPTNLFPDIRAPKITVSVTTNGLSPGEVERRIGELLERSIYSIRGVSSVKTISRADSAVVVVDFSWDTRLEYAFLEVKKAASDLQRDRGEEIESLSVLRYDPNAMPVVTAALTAPPEVDPETVFRTTEQSLKPRFERLEGVANVVLSGGVQKEILISLDETLLLARGVDVSAVTNALRQENVDASGGYVEEGARRYLLKAVGEFQSLDDISEVTVGRNGNVPITLGEVGTVARTPREPKSIVYTTEFGSDGARHIPAIGLSFYREAQSNTVAVAEAIRQEIEDSTRILPTGWKITVVNDQSLFISSAIREVRNNALLGGLLAIMVLLLFLRDLRTTLIVAVAIPISIVATFSLMYFQGLSLNLMTLGGLALGCGMLVDNAIVVLENVFRLREEGHEATEAARLGSGEVSGALIASTLTTVAVFLPIVFVEGVAGLLFKEQALTVAYSLLASLVVALLLIPMLAAYFLGPSRRRDAPPLVVEKNVYTRLLGLALRLRALVLLAAIGVLVLTVMAFRSIPQEFLPASESRQVSLRVVLSNGTPVEATNRVSEAIASQLEAFAPAIDTVYTMVGEPEGVIDADTEDPDGPNTADVHVVLKSDDRPTTAVLAAGLGTFSSSQLVAALKPVVERIPDAKTEFRTGEGSLFELLGGARSPLLIKIAGPELETLTTLAGEVQQRLRATPGLLNVRTNILEGAPEVRIRLDKGRLARNGLQVNEVAEIVKRRVEGEVPTQVRQEAGDVDIRVKVDYGTESLETLKEITFKSSTGALLRLGALGEFEIARSPREIVRERQERVAYVMADLEPGTRLSEGIDRAERSLADLQLPPRYGLAYTGEEEQRREAFGDLWFALILSIALVYMVMASIFESFLQPFLIMFTIPLAGVGVVGSLLATGQTLNVMSIIGVVMLGGIVVNNAIVLLDCVNQVRVLNRNSNHALSSFETLLVGCQRRLRPVLMTTATTLLGLAPMAMGFGEGAELRQAMAITVLGGLATSTVLTLFVIPCCQSFLDSILHAAARLRTAQRERRAAKSPNAAPEQSPPSAM